jgi:hypothetical protein
MTEGEPEKPDQLERFASELLNAHGYAFQEAVIRAVSFHSKIVGLELEYCAKEFPVSVGDEGSRIDLVFAARDKSFFLLGECKRSDPGFAHWIFFRAPPPGQVAESDRITIELLAFNPGQRFAHEGSLVRSATSATLPSKHQVFRVAFETSLREGKSIDKQVGSSTRAIELPCSQLARALNGVVGHFARVFARDTSGKVVRFMPVLFTTASLWTSDASLADADLSTGSIQASDLRLRAAPWLLYDYVLSPGIKHGLSWLSGNTRPHTHDFLSDALDLGRSLHSDFTRTMAVVSPSGINDFLLHIKSVIPTT